MKPVKIRYLGILPLTRKLYWKIVIWGWVGVTIMLIAIAITLPGRLPPLHWPWDPRPPHVNNALALLYWHLYDLYAICILAQIIDAAIMMRKFKSKEEEEERKAMIDGVDG